MKLIISRSAWRKLTVLLIAIVGFVLLYEARTLDSTGLLEGLIGQVSAPAPGTQLQFNATAYCKGTTTASGVGVRTGIAAADPTLLPVGSVLNIGTGDNRYNGVYTVMDTGPKVQGRILDLYMWNCNEALRFGRKEVRVTVLRLGWDPRASSPGLIDRLFRGREARRRVPPPEPPPPAGIAPEEAPAEPDVQAVASEGVAAAPGAEQAPEGTTEIVEPPHVPAP